MRVRRLAATAIGGAAAIGLFALLCRCLDWDVWSLAIAACFLGVAPWLGLCAANGLLGFAVRDPRRLFPGTIPSKPALPTASRTAIAVTIRDEDVAAILLNLTRLLAGLDALGAGHLFGVFVLSDSADPTLEQALMTPIIATDSRFHYRHRLRNTHYKAGNILEFLTRYAEDWPFTIIFDADTQMSAAAVVRLTALMQANPTLGLVQHLTVGLPAETAFARLFQFGMRAGMRSWARGQAWWQGDESPYWGHNAIFRSVPFRDHARLAPLPDGSPILSHDQVEAAQLRAAGWGVTVWPEETGSFEQNPPALPEFIARDRRWLAGNLQYLPLLRRPDLRAMGRWQLLQAVLLFAGAPLYLTMFLLAVARARLGAPAAAGPVATLALSWAAVLYAPKLLGYVEILVSHRARAHYGGLLHFAAGALCEIMFTLLLDAPMTVVKTLALLRVLRRQPPSWLPQNRAARRVSWYEATRMLWPATLLGIVTFAALAGVSWRAVALAAPFAGGLLAAIPLAVWSAGSTLSTWLARHRIAATPEELAGTW